VTTLLMNVLTGDSVRCKGHEGKRHSPECEAVLRNFRPKPDGGESMKMLSGYSDSEPV
jgi:hypothetical protein